MQPFTQLTGLVAPLDRVNVDTDQIIPKQFLKTIKRTGLREGLFFDWRRQKDGSPDPSFFLNQPRYQGATILFTRDNFGCGSSREHAPWALLDQGFRCVIAASFADIFYNNCFQNGILPVVLKPEARADDDEGRHVQAGISSDRGPRRANRHDARGNHLSLRDRSLQERLPLSRTGFNRPQLQHEPAITAYEARRKAEAPWLFSDLRP